MPCYNEIDTIDAIVEAVKNMPYHNKEIMIVDDCSTDGTREKLKNKIESSVEKVIYHEHNQGKGAALRSGIKAATGDIIIVQDTDLEYDPNEIPKVIQPILDGKADVVYGSRFLGDRPHRVLYYWHMVGNKFLTTLSNMFTNINLTDMETCYKVFRGEIIRKIRIEEDRFGFEPEGTSKVGRSGRRLYEG